MHEYYSIFGLAAFLTITADIIFECFIGTPLSPLAILGVMLVNLVISYIWVTE